MSEKPTKNLHPISLEGFDPTAEDRRAELEKLRTQVEHIAQITIDWYLRRKERESKWSRWLRLAAIVFTTIGGLMPIVQGFNFFPNILIGQAGYVCLALAAACVGCDHFFGFSTAWMRFMTTEAALQHDLAEFQMDWFLLLSEQGKEQPDATMTKRQLERLKIFRLQILKQVRAEMQVWVNEFHSILLQLEHNTTLQKQENDHSNKVVPRK